MMRQADAEYYALYVVWGDGTPEVARLELGGRDEYGTFDAIAVYTSPDSPQQREDLEKWGAAGASTEIRQISHEELLNVLEGMYVRSVFIDGKKFARSVVIGMLKTALGLEIKHPQIIRLDAPEHDDPKPE